MYPIGPESAVSNFTRLNVTSNSITLSWSPPAQSNGPVTGYNINCFINDEPNTAELPGSVTSHTITGLRVFTLYTCVIIAQNVEGGGPPTSLSVLTDQDCEYTNIILLLIVCMHLLQLPVDHLKSLSSQSLQAV